MTEQSPYSERRAGQALTTPRQQPSPGPQEEQSIASLIARMMLHFWAPQELSDGARKAMAADWIADLREFGPDIVSRACGEWRRTQSKRPTIADIRKLCVEDQRLQPPFDVRAEWNDNWRDAYAKSAGFSSWLERQDAIDKQQERYRLAQEWRDHQPAAGAASGFKSPAAALGVTAREWTADEMAMGRQKLGMEG